jgi:hypothetical protein
MNMIMTHAESARVLKLSDTHRDELVMSGRRASNYGHVIDAVLAFAEEHGKEFDEFLTSEVEPVEAETPVHTREPG